MRECSRCGRGFAFSLEATLSLLACLAFVSMLSFHAQEDLSDVVVYKQASDFLQVVIKDGSLEARDVAHMKELLHGLGLKARLEVDGETVFDDQPEPLARVERTLITEELDYQRVVLVAGA